MSTTRPHSSEDSSVGNIFWKKKKSLKPKVERRIVLHFLNNSVSVWMMSRPAWTSWLSCVACVRFTGIEASCEPASCTSRYQTFWALRRSWYPTPGRSGVQRPEAQTRIRCAWPRGRLRRFEQSVFCRSVTNYDDDDYYLTDIEINRSAIW